MRALFVDSPIEAPIGAPIDAPDLYVRLPKHYEM